MVATPRSTSGHPVNERCSRSRHALGEARPSFTLDDATRPAVTEICERLDNLPLAIELAASRVRVLSAHQIVALLGDPELLTDTTAACPKRPHSLAAVMAWSYELLSDQDRDMLLEVSVFVGSFSLRDVAAMQGRPMTSLVDAISSLVDHSMLTRFDGTDGAARYRLLETVRGSRWRNGMTVEALSRCSDATSGEAWGSPRTLTLVGMVIRWPR